MIILLLGIFAAALLFSAVLWAGYRAYVTRGHAQMVNLLSVLLTLLTMALVTWQLAGAGPAIGAMLAVSALLATYYEDGWSRLLPLTLAAFGVFVVLGTPFS